MNETRLYWIAAQRFDDDFPDISQALPEPDGLLAAGGDLDHERLLSAYRRGIFPWYDASQPILWWSPDPRAVLYPDHIHISRSLSKTLRSSRFQISFDQAFKEVIKACSTPRNEQTGTWLTSDMMNAYIRLHHMGHAHSIECWYGNQLVGGLYGIAIGQVFFGESMFSRMSDASKVCMVKLGENLSCWGYKLIDCQVDSHHLRTMGAVQIPRTDFKFLLDQLCPSPPSEHAWKTLIIK